MDRHHQEKKRSSAYNAMDGYQQEKKRSSAFAAMDGYQHEKDAGLSDNIFNPIFSSLHNDSEDSGHRKYLDAPMEPPSPYRPKAVDTESTSDEALKHIRTANSITISPVDTRAGGYWFTEGSTLTPAFNAYGAYASDPAIPSEGIASPGFQATFGFFLLFMGVLSLMYLICALRTNIVFVTIFFGLFMCFVILTGAYWHNAVGNAAMASKLQVASGAFALLACVAGWYIPFLLVQTTLA
ncbi:MAG: hypothetical protein Q9174_000576 [Haloplaca sp. 1 TL-2023]